MISVDGQYIFRVSVGDLSDFLARESLGEFTIIEEPGNVLPTFQMQFTYDDSLLSILNESNVLKVQLGKTLDELKDIELKVTNKVSMRVGQNQREYNISGTLDALPYLQEPKVKIYPRSFSNTVMRSVASEYFSVDSNIITTVDNQNWIRPNCSAKKFINDLWLHSHIPKSFMCVAITADKEFLMRDLRNTAAKGFLNYDWRFTKQPSRLNDIDYLPDTLVEDKSGFLNAWRGYGREIILNNMESGGSDSLLNEPSPLVALTSKFSKDKGITKKFGGVHYTNENHHSKYWESYYSNLANLAKFSSVRYTLSTLGPYFPIRPLDLCMVNESDTGSSLGVSSNVRSSENLSGFYFVSKVSRTISAQNIRTNVQLVRESLNQIREV